MMISRSLVLLLLILVSRLAGQEISEPQPNPVPIGSATIADFKGKLTLRSASGDSLMPQKGLLLQPETDITVEKGSVLLNLQDGSQALVKSKGHVVLKSPEVGIGMYLQLLLGKLLAKVQKRLGETPPFRMGTPSAVITVRGTRFEVEVTKNKRTYIEVFEGIVEVQGLMTGGHPALLRPGFSTQVESGREPAQPRNRTDEMRELNNRLGGPLGTEGPGRETERPGQEKPGSQSGEQEHKDKPD